MYDTQREKENPFIIRLKEEDPALYDEMTQYGRRNVALLTIAPTGTTSLMTQTTSGIEPVFRPVYTRRRKVNPNDSNVKVALQTLPETLLKNSMFSITNLRSGWKITDTTLMRWNTTKKSALMKSSKNPLTTKQLPMILTGFPRWKCRAKFRNGWITPSA